MGGASDHLKTLTYMALPPSRSYIVENPKLKLSIRIVHVIILVSPWVYTRV